MAVVDQSTRASETANGITAVFPYPFQVQQIEDLQVFVDSVRLTGGYAVSGLGNQLGGNVTLSSPPAAGLLVELVRRTVLERDTDYQQHGAFPAPVVNKDFDRAILALQEQRDTIDALGTIADAREAAQFAEAANAAAQTAVAQTTNAKNDANAASLAAAAAATAAAASAVLATTGSDQFATQAAASAGLASAAQTAAVTAASTAVTSASASASAASVAQGSAQSAQTAAALAAASATQAADSSEGATTLANAALTLAPSQAVNTTFHGPEVGEIPVKLFDIIRGFVDPIRFGADGDGVTDDAPAMNAALATGKFVELRPLSYAIGSPLTMAPGGGIVGQQEKSRLIRTGHGRLIGFPGGNQVGEPITLRDFCLDSAITAVAGDTGIDIGYGSTWVGRGDIANLTILAQFDGFKWTGGSVNPMRNIQVYEGKGRGFYGINPRGELHECLAEHNLSDGFLVFTSVSGETGLRLLACGTFANGGLGLILDAAASQAGANIWADTFSSSFDAMGGIYCIKPYSQLRIDSPFLEYAGYARDAGLPSVPYYPSAAGLVLGSGVSNSVVSNAQILHCAGAAASFDGTQSLSVHGIQVIDNGQSGGSGGDRNGVNVSNGNTNLVITGINGGASSIHQVFDLAINTTDNTGSIRGENIHSIYSVPQTTPGLRVAGLGLPMPNVAAANILTLPVHADTILVNASANINAITPSWPDRMVRLIFDGVLTVANGNNLHLNGTAFVTAVDSVLTLVAVGDQWFEVSRTNDR